jgi:hypothetical protein
VPGQAPGCSIDWYIQVEQFAKKGNTLVEIQGLSSVHLGVLVPQPFKTRAIRGFRRFGNPGDHGIFRDRYRTNVGRHRQLGASCGGCGGVSGWVVGWDDDHRSVSVSSQDRRPRSMAIFRFPVGLRMVEELLVARGIISH